MPRSERLPQRDDSSIEDEQEQLLSQPASDEGEERLTDIDSISRPGQSSALEDVMADANRQVENYDRQVADKARAQAIKKIMKVDRNLLRQLREDNALDTLSTSELNQIALEGGLERSRQTRENNEAAARHRRGREMGFHKTEDELKLERDIRRQENLRHAEGAFEDADRRQAEHDEGLTGEALIEHQYEKRVDWAIEVRRDLMAVVDQLQGRKISAMPKWMSGVIPGGSKITFNGRPEGEQDFTGSLDGLEMKNQFKAEEYFEKRGDEEALELLDQYDVLMAQFRELSRDLQSRGTPDRVGVGSAERFDIDGSGFGYEKYSPEEALSRGAMRDEPEVEGYFDEEMVGEEAIAARDAQPEIYLENTARAEAREEKLNAGRVEARRKIDAALEQRFREKSAESRAEELHADADKRFGYRDVLADARNGERESEANLQDRRHALAVGVIDQLDGMRLGTDVKEMLAEDVFFGETLQEYNGDVRRAAGDYKDYLDSWFASKGLLGGSGQLNWFKVKFAVARGRVSRAQIDEQMALSRAMDDLMESTGSAAAPRQMSGRRGVPAARKEVTRKGSEWKNPSEFNAPAREVRGVRLEDDAEYDHEVEDGELQEVLSTPKVIDMIDEGVDRLGISDNHKLALYDHRFMDALSDENGDMMRAASYALNEVEDDLAAAGAKFASNGSIDGRSARKYANTDNYKLYAALVELQDSLIRESTRRHSPPPVPRNS